MTIKETDQKKLLHFLAIVAVACCVFIVSGVTSMADTDPAVESMEYVPAHTDLVMDEGFDLVDGYWDMEESNIHPIRIQKVEDSLVADYYDDSKYYEVNSIHSGDTLILHYDNGEKKVFKSKTYLYWAGAGSMEYQYCIAWYDADDTLADMNVIYSYTNYVERNDDNLRASGTYDTKVTVFYRDQEAQYSMKITVPGNVKKSNPVRVKAKTITVKASQLKKSKKVIARNKAMSVKNAKGTLHYKKISGPGKISVNKKTGKITIGKKLKKGSYKLKVKVTCDGNTYYQKARRTITIRVKVR